MIKGTEQIKTGFWSRIGSFFGSIKNSALNHKFISLLIIIALFGGGWFGYKKINSASAETRYVIGTTATSTIISTITASGQVSASDTIDIKPKASGELIWVGIKAGDTVHVGQSLMSIDNTDARRNIVSAENSLATSKLQLQKDEASAPIDYQKTVDSLTTAQNDLDTTFNDTFNSLSNTYLDLPTAVTGIQDILYGYDLNNSKQQWNIDFLESMFNNKQSDLDKIKSFGDRARSDYETARTKYDASILAYKNITRSSPDTDIEKVLAQSIDTATAIAQATQSELNFLSAVTDVAQSYNMKLPTTVTTMQSNARTYLSTANSDLSDLLAKKKTIDTSKQTIKTYQQNIELLKVGNPDGSNPISLQISKNNIASQEQSLAQLKADLSNYTVFAPFDGLISAVNVKVGDTASGAVATIITKQQIAELSLNEVDAAQVKVGDKATLNFDAIEGLTMTGTVSEKDSVGTVSSGVVSYKVKITFDTQDSRVNPGMTVNAVIQTAVHQDVLTVPSTAVKTKNGSSYVLAFTPALANVGDSTGVLSTVAPEQIPVEIGITDGTNTEILSGLESGQQIVTKTITSTTKTTTTKTTSSSATKSATSIIGGSGGPGGPGF